MRRIADFQRHGTTSKNAFWLFLEKILRIGVTFFLNIWITRSLDPEMFGIWNYSIAIVMLISSVIGLGIESVLLKFLTDKPHTLGKKYFDHILTFRLAVGLFSFLLLIVVTLFYFSPGIELYLFIIVGTNTIWQSAELFDVFAQYTDKIAGQVKIKIFSFLLTSILKVVGLYTNCSVVFFAAVSSLELMLYFLVSLISNYKRYSSLNFQIYPQKIRSLLKVSLPLFLSNVLIIIYMRSDQIIIEQLCGPKELGLYSAALKLSELWYLIPTMAMTIFSKELYELSNQNKLAFTNKLSMLYVVLTLTMSSVAFMASLTGNWITELLYGNKYYGSGNILIFHIWTAVFVAIGLLNNIYSIANNLQSQLFQKSLIGALLNIGLNYILVEKWGGIGSAIATTISYAVVTLVLDIFWKSTHALFFIRLNAFSFTFLKT